MKIIIGADLVPTVSNAALFAKADVQALVGNKLLEVLAQADYRIFNLEVPLTDVEKPIEKCGPNLIAPTKTVAGIKAMGVDFLTLANNHILDQGEQGLASTIDTLKKAKISFAGIGNNLQEAAIPYVIDGKQKIGIYCCAEHEFSIATENTMGANPFDALETPDHISQLKSECDYVICLYHGGKEHYRYPSPMLQKRLRKIVEKGADLVIAQHTHCVGCMENYLGGTIVYGQGNFLFDNSDSEYWQTSLLLSVDTENREIDFVPITKKQASVTIASEDDAAKIKNGFLSRSEQIRNTKFVSEEFAKFADSLLSNYVLRTSMLTKTLPFRIMNKLLGNHLKLFYVKRLLRMQRMGLLNQYECEAHREVVVTALKKH